MKYWFITAFFITLSPGGHEFKIDVTEYNPGPHKVRIIAYDPVTGSSSEEIIPFYTPSTPRGERSHLL